MKKRYSIALAGVVAIAAFTAPAAEADHHLVMIKEVHLDSGGAGDADYVVLQSYAAGQNVLATRKVIAYGGDGSTGTSPIVFTANVTNSSNQATAMVSNYGGFVPNPDRADPAFNVTGGAGWVCFTESDSITAVDCVSYGPVTGTPAAAASSASTSPGPALSGGQSIVRTEARGCVTQLDPSDDTNNSAADFAIGTPNPRNNASPITETPCTPATPPATTPSVVASAPKKCKKKKLAVTAKKKKCKKKK